MRLLRKRRGVSGIISGVFLVAVAVMIFNILAWQFFQYDAYHRTVLERDQLVWERYNERLIAYLPEVGVSKLNFTVRNYGTVSAHIVDLFFRFNNGTCLYYQLDVWIAPGALKRIANVGPTLLMSDVYYFQIGTERGNITGPIPTGSGGISNEPKPGQGQAMPFIFGFGYNDFQYKYSGNWYPAWNIDKTRNPDGYKIKLNNTYSKTVILTSNCRIAFVPDDFSTSNTANIDLGQTSSIPPNSGADFFFSSSGNFPTGKNRWYVFIEIFYYFSDEPPSNFKGTNVGVLSILVTKP